MATVSISLLPKVNQQTNIIEEDRFVIDENGNVVRQKILLDSSESSAATYDIVKESISYSFGQSSFQTSNPYRRGSLFVFLNGMNISADVVEVDDQNFSVGDGYLEIEPEEYEIFVSYTKKV